MFYFHVMLSCTVIVYCFHVLLSCTVHVMCSCTNFIYCIHVLFMYYFHVLYLFIYFSCIVLYTFHIMYSCIVSCPMYFSYNVTFHILSSCTFHILYYHINFSDHFTFLYIFIYHVGSYNLMLQNLSSHSSAMLLRSYHIFSHVIFKSFVLCFMPA